MTPSQISLHVYTDFDSTVVLQDTGNTLLAFEMGEEELGRIDRLPKTAPGEVSIRKAEDMKWSRLRFTIQEAADILVDPNDDVLLQSRLREGAAEAEAAATSRASKRMSFDQRSNNQNEERSYYVRLDQGFKRFHRFCQEHNIPITVVSIGIQPLIEEMLNRYLGHGHGIVVRANGLTFQEDGSWKVLWRDTSPFGVEKGRALREARANDLKKPSTDQILWCGDGTSDFPAALASDIVLARQDTTLEKVLKANQISHRAFTTFDTVLEVVNEWIQEHPRSEDFEP
ncbi:hypothetical protein BGZ80_006335 [Entomortierella chlamydospora]|uniref:Phosphoserine phosphatase n=1 Tax=Entomortierella chlamydospora TaxID=101097 RepID=A0A9P6MZL1_9FUNG|nr:hypothetical protein BGZ79_010381 [Entomortierella chlamydospora]KAG0019078.1 hypothetical protein BGZ80_006335 [Entomortierella chlamydospora]